MNKKEFRIECSMTLFEALHITRNPYRIRESEVRFAKDIVCQVAEDVLNDKYLLKEKNCLEWMENWLLAYEEDNVMVDTAHIMEWIKKQQGTL